MADPPPDASAVAVAVAVASSRRAPGFKIRGRDQQHEINVGRVDLDAFEMAHRGTLDKV